MDSTKREPPGSHHDSSEHPQNAADASARRTVHTSLNAFSRVIAVLGLMFVPAVIGRFLDRYLQTQYWIVVGFVVGTVIALVGLISIALSAEAELKQTRRPKDDDKQE